MTILKMLAVIFSCVEEMLGSVYAYCYKRCCSPVVFPSHWNSSWFQ